MIDPSSKTSGSVPLLSRASPLPHLPRASRAPSKTSPRSGSNQSSMFRAALRCRAGPPFKRRSLGAVAGRSSWSRSLTTGCSWPATARRYRPWYYWATKPGGFSQPVIEAGSW